MSSAGGDSAGASGEGAAGPPKGMAAFKAHVAAHRVDVAMWAARLGAVLLVLGYVFPIFISAESAYYKALLANAAVSALRLHQRIPPREIALSREFLARLFLEDSAHYLFYSLIFMNCVPSFEQYKSYSGAVVLIPVFLFTFLHAASYSLTILDTLGQNSIPIARLLIALVEFKSRDILVYAAFAELALFPYVVVMALLGHCGLLTPFTYYYFVTWRYASRRNPYTRNTCRELRVAVESLAARPACPAPAARALRGLVGLVCRLAPPAAEQ